MFSEAEYLSLKGIKRQSLEEETCQQRVGEKRRCLQKMEANRLKQAAYSEEQKNVEKERNRIQRTKLTKEEATAITKRSTGLIMCFKILSDLGYNNQS